MGERDLYSSSCHTDVFARSLVVKHVGLNAAREEAKKVLDIKYEPKGDTALSAPKFGKEDPNNSPHTGGNTWAGGVCTVRSLCFFTTKRVYRQAAATLPEWAAEVVICAYTKAMIFIRCYTLSHRMSSMTYSTQTGVRCSEE